MLKNLENEGAWRHRHLYEYQPIFHGMQRSLSKGIFIF